MCAVTGVVCKSVPTNSQTIVPCDPPNEIIEWLINVCDFYPVNGYIMVNDTDIYAIEEKITRYSKRDYWVYMIDGVPTIIPSVRRMLLYVYNNRTNEFKDMPAYIKRQIDKLNSGVSIKEIRIY